MNKITANSDQILPLNLRIFEAVPGNNLLIKVDQPRFTMLAAGESYLQITGKTKAELIGKGVFEVFPSNTENPEDTSAQDLMASFEEVIAHKKIHHLPVQRYDVANEENHFIEKFWRISNTPILGEEGDVQYIISSVEDITKEVKARRREDQIKPLEQAHNLLLQAPMGIQIFKGPDLIIELANDLTLKMWDKDESAIGKPFLEVLPELKGEGYELLMQKVIQTGISKAFYETPIKLNRTGKEELGYYNFYYQPYYEEDKTKATGVLVFSTEVTEQVVTRKKIIQSEQSLKLALEIGELGVYSIHLKNNTANYSPQIMDWFELAEQHASMEEILLRIHPADRPLIEQTIERSFSKEWDGKHDLVFQVIQPQTGLLQYLHSIGQVQFEKDVPVSITGIIQNVTDQVLARKKIEASENKFRTLVMQAPFPIAVYVGKEMKIEMANQSILNMWGKGNDIVGKLYSEVLPELSNQEVFEQLDQVYHTGIPFHAKHQQLDLKVDGKLQSYYFNYSFTPLFDAQGKVYGVMNTGADVTDINIANKKVEESSQNLQNMVMQAPVAMCILKEPNHIIRIANDKQLELWGKDRDSVMNKPITEAIPESKSQGLEEVLNKIYTRGETYEAFELPLKMIKNGKMESVYINIEQRPYREADGRISGIMAVASDVTDLVLARHKIEEVVAKRTKELAEANEALKQNNTELEQFAYVAAHDLQEPLRTISNFVGLFVKKYGKIDPDAELYAKYILNATSKMKSLINDLLDYSRTGKNHSFVAVDLNQVLKEVMAEMNQTIKESQVKITATALPVIPGNETELRRLFQNLISNGIKFQKPNALPHIDISVNQQDTEYVFAFKDNGIGIEEHYMGKLFIIFQRLHTIAEYAGTGIGLATCKKIVSLHGGRIWVESEFGVGSTFYFSIPRFK